MEPSNLDCCDNEVNTHIDHFLARLPSALGLQRVLDLTLENPQEALRVLLEVRGALETEKRKAEALARLSHVIGITRARLAPRSEHPATPQFIN